MVDTIGAGKRPYHEPMELGETPQRVQGIVDAAERAARQLREQAEERATERIAEADRAGANRVQAAEAEAQEILAHARAQAEQTRNEAVAAGIVSNPAHQPW